MTAEKPRDGWSLIVRSLGFLMAWLMLTFGSAMCVVLRGQMDHHFWKTDFYLYGIVPVVLSVGLLAAVGAEAAWSKGKSVGRAILKTVLFAVASEFFCLLIIRLVGSVLASGDYE